MIRKSGSIAIMIRMACFVVLSAALLIAATGVAAAQDAPNTEQFMERLSTCAGNTNLKVDAETLESIRARYEHQRTQSKIAFRHLPVLLNIFPESERAIAYDLYINCVMKILRMPSETLPPFCDQAIIDRCSTDATADSTAVIQSCQRVIECEPDNHLAYSEIAHVHRRKGQWTEAENAAKEQLRIGQRLDDPRIMSQAEFNIGTIFLEQGMLDRAEAQARRSLEHNSRVGSDVANAANYRLLGAIALRRRNANTAEEHYLNSIKFYKKTNNRQNLAAAYLGLGYAQYHKKDREAACFHFGRAKTICEEIGLFEDAKSVADDMRRARCN